MSLSMLKQNTQILILDNLFEDSDKFKQMKTVPLNEENPFEYNFVMIDFQLWLYSIVSTKKDLLFIDKKMIKDFIDENRNILIELSKQNLIQSIDTRLTESDIGKLRNIYKMYMVFLEYIKKCQLRIFELYEKVSSKNNPTPLIPFSLGLNRLANRLYSIEEKPTEVVDKISSAKTDNGNSTKYLFHECRKMNDMIRCSKDFGITLYNVILDGNKTFMVPEDWKKYLSLFKENQSSFESRVRLTKSVFSQYIYTGFQSIVFSDGSEEETFFLNYPFSLLKKDFGINSFDSVKEVEFMFK